METFVPIFEDNKENDLVKEAISLLKTLFPTNEWINRFGIFVIKENEQVELQEWKFKLLKGRINNIAPDGKWSQEGWSEVEFDILNILVIKFGMGKFREYRKYLPGKNKQKMYTKMQRFIGVQSLEHFLRLKVDLCYLREKFYEKGCYKKKILPDSERQCLLKRYLTLWSFGSMELKKSDLDEVDVTLVYDIM
eukprot:snap_masked-scaffold_6-processed-gene-14.40-mRNA-1 protein AED:1.00 eAED:1.00 QI:0/0/0/0/1/1/2/0/192